MMGIWTPFANIRENLLALNDSHLADVVWEGLDTLRAIGTNRQGTTYNGRHVRAWQNNPGSLLMYVIAAEQELRGRGIGEEPRIGKVFVWYSKLRIPLAPVPPWWYGHPLFHRAQRSHLIAIDPRHYAQRMPMDTPLDLELIWPLEKENEFRCSS